MKRLIYILLLVIGWNTLTAQTYQVNNQKIRFMNALGIPAKDTAAANWANAADTSIILIRPGDSTLWYRYKGDFRKVGTGGGTAIVDTVNTISSKGRLYKVADSLRFRTTDSLPTAVSSIELNLTGAIHNTPVTFSRSGRSWSGTASLANQSGFTIFRRGSGTGAPSFGSIDSSYFGGVFASQSQSAVSSFISTRITDSLRSLVRLRASGSGGIQLQNSNGTNVADFGTANTTNGSIAGGWNVGGNLSVTGTSGFTGKATFTDSIVGVTGRLTSDFRINGILSVNGATLSEKFNVLGNSLFTTSSNKRVLIKDASHSTLSNLTSAITFSRTDGVDDLSAIFSYNNGGVALAARTGVLFATGGVSTYSGTVERLRIEESGDIVASSAIKATAQGNNITVGVDSSVTSTSYTLVLGDAGYLKRCSNASAITITVPTNASVAFPIGTTIYFSQQGAGKVSVSPATSDVTIQSEGSLLGTAGQHAVIGLIKVNQNRWLLVGNRG